MKPALFTSLTVSTAALSLLGYLHTPEEAQSYSVGVPIEERYCLSALDHQDKWIRLVDTSDRETVLIHALFLLNEEVLSHELRFGCE